MSSADQSQQSHAPDYFTNAAGYTPPLVSASNQDQQAFQAAVAAAVAAEMANRDAQAQAAHREPTPEEAARAAIDNAGKGLGIDERLAELYRHLDTIARKVGL